MSFLALAFSFLLINSRYTDKKCKGREGEEMLQSYLARIELGMLPLNVMHLYCSTTRHLVISVLL